MFVAYALVLKCDARFPARPSVSHPRLYMYFLSRAYRPTLPISKYWLPFLFGRPGVPLPFLFFSTAIPRGGRFSLSRSSLANVFGASLVEMLVRESEAIQMARGGRCGCLNAARRGCDELEALGGKPRLGKSKQTAMPRPDLTSHMLSRSESSPITVKAAMLHGRRSRHMTVNRLILIR